MKVVCAWCEREGKPSLLREEEPRGGGVTHGICDDHVQRLRAELPEVAAAFRARRGRGRRRNEAVSDRAMESRP